ncbi:Transcriptional repressor ILP1 [Camellia lanceoleosa]|uniref:Transcriptional repressor ILP1 n=1 Tax=Camellia lanceoleosa TaxID=1840588 RepID=A0ACC0GM06_9ERIC|nr:Transcriptional repressor ILP1 [Camellia lanceoleosa]
MLIVICGGNSLLIYRWVGGYEDMRSHACPQTNAVCNIDKVSSSLNAFAKPLKGSCFMTFSNQLVVLFLQHKAHLIEELEEQMQKLNEERAAAISERRAADNEDEVIEIEAAVNAAMSIFSKGGGSATMIERATSAAQAASAATKNKEIFLETAAYQSNRDLLLQTAEQVFSDAAEEYSQLSVVMEKFERWKKDYPLSYRDAYMSLSVPAIFSPYVRLELLKWDPLHEDIDFINMNWHLLLYNYGIEDENDISPDDADANLVPQLVEKVAVPILHHEIAHCWDMLSTHETKNAVSATDLVVRYVPASSEALVELVAVLHDRLADAIAKLMVPTWSPLVMKAVPNAARVAAYRFGTSVRLMRNICMWNKIIALSVLEKLVLDELLSGKVLPHLRSIQSNVHDAVTRTERVIASLSGVWSGPSVAGQRSPKLQPLVDYLFTLGKTLEKKQVSGVSESETSGLARRLKKMLVDLNEYDQARAILRTFSLKEAL